MVSTVVTASFVVAALGSFYLLQGRHVAPARLFLRLGVTAGLVSSVLVAFPTGDRQAKLVARHQPVALAAMEGRFESGSRASLNIIGQPNVRERRLENPIAVPDMLSFLAYGHFYSDVRGLDEVPQKDCTSLWSTSCVAGRLRRQWREKGTDTLPRRWRCGQSRWSRIRRPCLPSSKKAAASSTLWSDLPRSCSA
jgi:cytochrome bd-type quinol oxidase subunit 1